MLQMMRLQVSDGGTEAASNGDLPGEQPSVGLLAVWLRSPLPAR